MSAQPPRMIASSSGATRRPRGSVVVASRWAHAIRGGDTAWARATPTCPPSAHVFVSPVLNPRCPWRSSDRATGRAEPWSFARRRVWQGAH